MDHLLDYAWPGNIRELKNVIERALVLCDAPEIPSGYLPLDKMMTLRSAFDTDEVGVGAKSAALEPNGVGFDVEHLPPLYDPVDAAERKRILDALAANAWNQTRAAESLGMPRRTFVSKLDHYKIPRPQKHGSSAAGPRERQAKTPAVAPVDPSRPVVEQPVLLNSRHPDEAHRPRRD